jgi:hypothetical protein
LRRCSIGAGVTSLSTTDFAQWVSMMALVMVICPGAALMLLDYPVGIVDSK